MAGVAQARHHLRRSPAERIVGGRVGHRRDCRISCVPNAVSVFYFWVRLLIRVPVRCLCDPYTGGQVASGTRKYKPDTAQGLDAPLA